MTPLWPVVLADPPLLPDPDEARSQLRRELARPEYQDLDLVGRVLRWLERAVDQAVAAASEASGLQAALAMAVLLALALVVLLVASRFRGTARTRATRTGPVLADPSLTAAELRARAERALAAGDAGAALVDAYRALAVRQVELGRAEERPGATAHEVAVVLAADHPDDAAGLRRAADLFDRVLYGHRPATERDARTVLELEDRLAERRGVRR